MRFFLVADPQLLCLTDVSLERCVGIDEQMRWGRSVLDVLSIQSLAAAAAAAVPSHAMAVVLSSTILSVHSAPVKIAVSNS